MRRILKEISWYNFQPYQKRRIKDVATNGKLAGISVLHVKRTILKKMFHSLYISIMVDTDLVLILFKQTFLYLTIIYGYFSRNILQT